MIDRQQVLKIAQLARLRLSEEEIENFTKQIDDILSYVEQLNGVDTKDIDPTCFLRPAHDPLRDDVEKPSLPREETLKNGPKVKGGFFAVPKVL